MAVCLEQYKITYMTETVVRNNTHQPLLCVESMLKSSVFFVQKKNQAAAAPCRWCYRAAVSDGHDGQHVLQGASLLHSRVMGERGPGHRDSHLLALLTVSHLSNP